MINSLLLLHAGVTLAMVGLIWFVQVVHYPLMAQVGLENFRRYEIDHQRLTTYVVAPLMLTEMTTALLLFLWRPAGVSQASVMLGVVLLVAIWVMTYSVQVPQHTALTAAFDAEVQQRLVRGNWLRTGAWTLRGVLVLWMIAQAMNDTVANTIPVTVAR